MTKSHFKILYKVLNFTAPTAPTAPNSTEIQKSSTSVEYRVIINCTWHCTNCTKLNWDTEIFVSDELHQLHLNCTNCTWELHLTAPTAPELHQYGKSRVSVDDAWFFFNYYLWKVNIVKNCECTECEFLRGLWESDIKNCNSGELHLTAPTAPELHQYGNLRCEVKVNF